jgi:hypothetical protein
LTSELGMLNQVVHLCAYEFHEASPVFCHEGVGNLAVFAEGAGGADLVEAHEARVARYVSRDDGRQFASNPT